jgi:hypothetical protein
VARGRLEASPAARSTRCSSTLVAVGARRSGLLGRDSAPKGHSSVGCSRGASKMRLPRRRGAPLHRGPAARNDCASWEGDHVVACDSRPLRSRRRRYCARGIVCGQGGPPAGVELGVLGVHGRQHRHRGADDVNRRHGQRIWRRVVVRSCQSCTTARLAATGCGAAVLVEDPELLARLRAGGQVAITGPAWSCTIRT